MTSYQTWTYDQVRAQIIEAADTLMMGEPDRGPGYAGLMQEVVREVAESYGYGSTAYKRIPTPGALARMEECWTWINTWLNEDDRRLVYEYGFVMTRKGHTIAGWCERNGWIKRTFERAVNRCCQQIANELNRKHKVRLTTAFDDLSQNGAYTVSSEVASDTSVQAQRSSFVRTPDAVPTHDPSEEAAAEIARHIEKVNQQRRGEAERQRKIALRQKEETARLAADVAKRQERQQGKKRQAA